MTRKENKPIENMELPIFALILVIAAEPKAVDDLNPAPFRGWFRRDCSIARIDIVQFIGPPVGWWAGQTPSTNSTTPLIRSSTHAFSI